MISNSLISVLLLLIYLKQQNTKSCSLQKDCFNCSALKNEKKECLWNNGLCYDNLNGSRDQYWWDSFAECKDSKSEEITSNYCGNQDYIIEEQKLALSLPLINGYYGASNIYCKYTIINPKKRGAFSVSIANIIINQTVVLDIQALFNDKSVSYKSITMPDFSINFNKIDTITFYYYSLIRYSNRPFMIYIAEIEENPNITLYISIGLIIGTCLICSFSIYLFSKKVAERRLRERQLMMIAQRGDLPALAQQKSENAKKLDLILNTNLKGKPFLEEHKKLNSNCSICLEEFGNDSVVSITSCSHIFHYSCLRNWLTKNILHPKCPNCNTNILVQDANKVCKDLENINHIQINRFQPASFSSSALMPEAPRNNSEINHLVTEPQRLTNEHLNSSSNISNNYNIGPN